MLFEHSTVRVWLRAPWSLLIAHQRPRQADIIFLRHSSLPPSWIHWSQVWFQLVPFRKLRTGSLSSGFYSFHGLKYFWRFLRTASLLMRILTSVLNLGGWMGMSVFPSLHGMTLPNFRLPKFKNVNLKDILYIESYSVHQESVNCSRGYLLSLKIVFHPFSPSLPGSDRSGICTLCFPLNKVHSNERKKSLNLKSVLLG